MEQTTVSVEGMSCEGCEQNVVDALSALDGVAAATADHEDGRVRVEHDPAVVDVDALDGAIEDAGYDVVG